VWVLARWLTSTGTPFSTLNHWGKKGHITFGQSQAEFVPLP
jgi:hypothetical protein